VVGSGHNGAHAPNFSASLPQTLKGLGAGDFMDQVAVNVQDGGAVFFSVDDMFVPNFVVKRTFHGAS
jgi:hypothetical protein